MSECESAGVALRLQPRKGDGGEVLKTPPACQSVQPGRAYSACEFRLTEAGACLLNLPRIPSP